MPGVRPGFAGRTTVYRRLQYINQFTVDHGDESS